MTRARHSRNRRGFTLIELMIVTAIVSILAFMAVPNIAGMLDRSRVGQDAREIYSVILESAGETIRSGKDRRFEFDRTTNSWSLLEDRDQDNVFETTLRSGQLSEAASFGPMAGWGESYKGGYQGISSTSWCTFCNDDDGAVILQRDGSLRLEDSNAASGVFVVSMTGNSDDVAFALLFVAATGEVQLIGRGRD